MKRISVGVLKDIGAWIALPKELEINIQHEGSTKWKAVGRKLMNEPLSQEEPVRKEVIFTCTDAQHIKKIQIKFVNAGALQEWHPGAGYPSYFFLDEVKLD